MDLNLTQVRSLVAIVRYGGYHRAAEALHLTQPAVSRHVRGLERTLGEPLFERRGRGVELTPFGERATRELSALLDAHDATLARLERDEHRPFVLGTVEHLVDPVLPELLATTREAVDGRAVTLRVDRSAALVERVARGEVDAAIVMNPYDAPDPLTLGTLPLRWWAAPALAAQADDLPDPLPVVAYDPPCGLRTLSLELVAAAGLGHALIAESPHLNGIQAAVRNGLGYALLGAGADGLRPLTSGPLAGPQQADLFLVLGQGHGDLAQPLRAALWRATRRRPAVAA